MRRERKLKMFFKIASRDEPIFEPMFYQEESGYDDFYPDIESGKIEYEENLDNVYCGKKVCWIGDKGKMLKVNPDYMYSIQGNQFYKDKLSYLTEKIKSSPKTFLYAPYGILTIIGEADIRESLEYADEGYEHKPLTTGDNELDDYLTNEDDYSDRADEMSDALKEAAREGRGDFGAQLVQIRDGNHRAFAAAAAGESSIWVRMYANQLQDIKSDRPWAAQYKQYLK